jgi:hypothetical protein
VVIVLDTNAPGDGEMKFDRNGGSRIKLLVCEGVGSDKTDRDRLVDILEDQKNKPTCL